MTGRAGLPSNDVRLEVISSVLNAQILQLGSRGIYFSPLECLGFLSFPSLHIRPVAVL